MKMTLSEWYFNMWLEKPLSAIELTIFIFGFPTLWFAQYFYIRANKVGLSNMIFGEGNAWAQGKAVYLTDPIVFYTAFSLAAGIEFNKVWAKVFGWSKEKLDSRLAKARKNQRGNGPLIEEDKLNEFKATYPKFILLGRLMWLLIWLLIVCAALAALYSS